MKKSIFAVAVVGALFAGAASAATGTSTITFDLDDALNANFGATTFSRTVSPVANVSSVSFDDFYTFSVPGANLGDPSGTYSTGTTKISKVITSNSSISDIVFYSVDSHGGHHTIATDFGGGDFSPTFTLNSGSYGFEVTGNTLLTTTKGSAVGTYSGNFSLTLTPVPEPETYGMLLVGLGLLGFTARRKSNPKLG